MLSDRVVLNRLLFVLRVCERIFYAVMAYRAVQHLEKIWRYVA